MAKSGTSRVPMAPGQIPAENKIFRDFKGLNTQAARQAINDDEFSWLENVMPIGPANMPALYQISAALATLAGGVTIYYRKSYNLTGTNYLFLACTDGSAWQMLETSPYTVKQIAAAGTFSGNATQIAQWKNERILIIDTNALGYRDWDGTTLTTLSGTTGAPASGTCIASYSSHVWIVQLAGSGRTIAYSKPNDYTDFTGSGGTTTITDETLTSSIQQFLVANNFLYFFGIDSINVIADVQVVAGATQFSNTNIVANSGSNLPQSIVSFYRSVWYMNTSGIYALYGATPRKASDALDGIVALINFANPITAGTVTLFNELCIAFCFTYNDPAGARQLLAIYYNKKWFLASQSTDVTGIAAQHGGNDLLWGTAGASVYQLFQDSASAISQKIQTRLWDMDDFISIKESLNVGVEIITPDQVGGVTLTVDSERFTVNTDVPLTGTFSFTWYNSTGALFTWTNSIGGAFTWLTSGYVWLQSNVQIQGHYLGLTCTSTVSGNVFEGFQLQFRRQPAGWGM